MRLLCIIISLSVILFTPLVGALLLLFIPRESACCTSRWSAICSASSASWFRFRSSSLVQAGMRRLHISKKPPTGFLPSARTITLGIDGISLLLVMLTTFLGMIAILSSWSAIQMRTKEYYILLLLLQTGMLGVFVSLDFFLFYVFWEVMLVPMYFLIGVWGSDRRLYAAIKFFLYTLAGSVLMLLAILALYFNADEADWHPDL